MKAINKRTNCSADMSAEKGKKPWRDRARLFRTRVAGHGCQVRGAGGDVTCVLISRATSSHTPQAPSLDAELCGGRVLHIPQSCCCSAPKAVVLHRAVFGSKREGPVDSAAQAIVKAPWRIERDKRHLAQCVGGPCQRLASESVAIIGAPCSRIRLRAAHKQCGRACS